MTVKISEVIQLLEEFGLNIFYSDLTSEVHFGCNCGCGGDSYTSELWDEMVNGYDETEAKCIQFCEENGFDYDFGIDPEYRVESNKHSFNSLWYSYYNCNLYDEPSNWDTIEEFNKEREYFKESNYEFIRRCTALGYINDLEDFQGV